MAHPTRRGIIFHLERPDVRVPVEFTYEPFDPPSVDRNRIGSGRLNTPADVRKKLVGQTLILQAEDGEELRINLQGNGEFYHVIDW